MRNSNMRELDGQPRRKIRGWKCCVWGTCSSGARGTVVAVESCAPSTGLDRYGILVQGAKQRTDFVYLELE
jgi:hypothetical protein